MQNNVRLFDILNPPTISNISITTVATPYKLNDLSPTTLLPVGAYLQPFWRPIHYTHNLRKTFAPMGILSLWSKNSYPELSITPTPSPAPPVTPMNFPSPLLIIQASSNSNGSFEKASTSSPRIQPPRTSSSIPPLSLSTNPTTSVNLLWTLVLTPVLLPPPLVPDLQ